MGTAAYPNKRSRNSTRGMDRYELIHQLGQGGMGVVWRARDNKTGGEVAIKIVKDASDPACLELFTKGWKTLSELSHANIIDFRDVDITVEDGERKPFFVMPLLHGTTLAELIGTSSERLNAARVVEIINQVCRGLQSAHQRGLVHRDLKPSNIFVMEDDTAKIIDFGVVYLAGSQSAAGPKATLQYMSPEQVQMKEITPSASELNPTISHGLSQVVDKCLAKQPIHRFSTARELSDTLAKAYRNEPIFNVAKLRDDVDRVKSAFKSDGLPLASELPGELESKGHLDPEITSLHNRIEAAVREKRVDQLIAVARARIDQDEIPLAVDKLRELLELDPENAEGLMLKSKAEKKRSESQAGKWIELSNARLSICDFGSARQTTQEALISRPGDPRALELLRKIGATELEWVKPKNTNSYVYLTPGCLNVNLVFKKPKASFIGRRPVESAIETCVGGGLIAWVLGGDKVSRRTVAQHTFDQHEVNVGFSVNDARDTMSSASGLKARRSRSSLKMAMFWMSTGHRTLLFTMSPVEVSELKHQPNSSSQGDAHDADCC